MEPSDTTIVIQGCLDRLQAGDVTAREQLVNHAFKRLRLLTEKMFRASDRVHRWEETDDVFQNSVMRLHKALKDVTPATVEDFLGFAREQIRRELIDLARRHYGPLGQGAMHATKPRGSDSLVGSRIPVDQGAGPATQMNWVELHERVGELPEEELTAWNLFYYDGLTQEEIANRLGVSVRTVKRRIRKAKETLYRILGLQETQDEG